MGDDSFPLSDLPSGYFADGERIAAPDYGSVELRRPDLATILNRTKAQFGKGIYYVKSNTPGAFPNIAAAVERAVEEIPVQAPRLPATLFLDPGEWHEADIDLPLSHSWIFDGGSFTHPFMGTGGLVGRVRTPSQKQDATNPERNRVIFRNLSLGNGGYTPGPTGFVLEADVGWNVSLIDSLLVGGIIDLYSDPLITAAPNSTLYLYLKNIVNNGASCIRYRQPARSNPGTTILVDRCSLLGGDGEFGDFPGSLRLDGYLDIRISNTDFLGFAEAGPGWLKGIGAAPCSGSIRFLNSHFYVLAIFAQMNFFGANLSGVTFEWGEGASIEEANYGVPAPPAMNLAGITHRKAPVMVSRTAPLSPPRGTVRRDENATEKYLFWNGAAWV